MNLSLRSRGSQGLRTIAFTSFGNSVPFYQCFPMLDVGPHKETVWIFWEAIKICLYYTFWVLGRLLYYRSGGGGRGFKKFGGVKWDRSSYPHPSPQMLGNAVLYPKWIYETDFSVHIFLDVIVLETVSIFSKDSFCIFCVMETIILVSLFSLF